MYVIYNEDGTVFKVIYEIGVDIELYLDLNNYTDKYYEFREDISDIDLSPPKQDSGVKMEDRIAELENIIDIILGGDVIGL